MYAVILAGGGGTRLHPLSRPERPKPFLPLLGERSLLQGTVDRLSGLTDDIMVVLPADQTVRDTDVFCGVLAAAAERLATGAFGVDDPLVTLGIRVDRPATEYGYLIPDVARGGSVGGLRAYPLTRFEEKPKPARAEQLVQQEGVAWNAGIFLWRRRAIAAALGRYTGLLQSLGPMAASPVSLESAYEAIQKPVSIDYAVMEGAAQNGQVVMAAMDVGWSDLGSWSALLGAIGARGTAL